LSTLFTIENVPSFPALVDELDITILKLPKFVIELKFADALLKSACAELFGFVVRMPSEPDATTTGPIGFIICQVSKISFIKGDILSIY
jgi:hypothetical protein